MISYDVEVTWLGEGISFMLPATVCFSDDEGPDSNALRAQAVLLAVVEHNPSDFPDEVAEAEFVGATVATDG